MVENGGNQLVRTSWLHHFPCNYTAIQRTRIASAPLSIYSRYSAYTADTVYSDAAYTLYSAIHSPSGSAPRGGSPIVLLRARTSSAVEQPSAAQAIDGLFGFRDGARVTDRVRL